MADTGIEWTDVTWNPTRGCRRVSPGCEHCYAEDTAVAVNRRFKAQGLEEPYGGLVKLVGKKARWTGDGRFVPGKLAEPLGWKKPRRVFVNSMSDLFFEAFTFEQIAAVFGVMASAPQHTFQVLTKRPARMLEWFAWVDKRAEDGLAMYPDDVAEWRARQMLYVAARRAGAEAKSPGSEWPLPNVWLGVSVENQAAADERIPDLLATPAAVRFLSCEPLLGAIDLKPFLWKPCAAGIDWRSGADVIGDIEARKGMWVIAGCESGPGARPCEVSWLRSLRDQCAAAAVPFFLKQAVEDLGPLHVDAKEFPLARGPGAKRKARGIVALPYLDGVQHAAFPEVRP